MAEPARERLLTAPLLACLLLVGGVVGWAAWTRHPTPDMDGSIELLADGDLDGDERQRLMAHVVGLARTAESLRHRWVGVLAALAIADQAAFEQLQARLGDGAARVLPEADREWVDLADPMLGNALTAMCAEASNDSSKAREAWQQVRVQARLTAHAFAAQVADAALSRLR